MKRSERSDSNPPSVAPSLLKREPTGSRKQKGLGNETAVSVRKLKNYLGGVWKETESQRSLVVDDPVTGRPRCEVPFSDEEDVQEAVSSARDAFSFWSRIPPRKRAEVISRYRELVQRASEDIARTMTLERGVTLDESRRNVKLGLESLEYACSLPAHMPSYAAQLVEGIDWQTTRHPVGVFASLTPYYLPDVASLWLWPYAVVCGNSFIVKPSRHVPMTQNLMFELVDQAGFPEGVVNLLHGDRQTADALVSHPQVDGVSFIGPRGQASDVISRAATLGKRIRAVGRSRACFVVMPDADMDAVIPALISSCFGGNGQHCLAGSMVIAVDDRQKTFSKGFMEAAKRIVIGPGIETDVELGPMISVQAHDQACSFVQDLSDSGSKVLLDGRGVEVPNHPNGRWLGPTILEGFPKGTPLCDEVLAPIAFLEQVETLSQACDLVRLCDAVGVASCYTASGKTARAFRERSGVSMTSINVGLPDATTLLYWGGVQGAFLGDIKAHGREAIRFYTDESAVLSRWE